MTTSPRPARRPAVPLALLALALTGCEPAASTETPAETASVSTSPAIVAATPEQAGRYLVAVGGCNDCHTDGFLMDPSIPESRWLTGSPLGFRGPWGTSYAKNLRLTAASMTEDAWVQRLRGQGLPPMPWPSVNSMSEADARAVYRYVRSLGEPGAAAPVPLAPGVEPTTPWIDFVPRNLPAAAAS